MLILWLIVFWYWLVVNTTYAEEYSQADIDTVRVLFCDKLGDEIHTKIVDAGPWKENKISFCIYNTNPTKKIPVSYFFNTSVYDVAWNRVCNSKTDMTDNTLPIIPAKKDNTIWIDPMGGKMIEENIVIPPWIAAWPQMWCLAVEIWGTSNIDMWWIFFMKVQKVLQFDVIVGWMTAIKNSIKILNTSWWIYTTDKKIRAKVDQNNFTLWFLIENNGNVGQTVDITWKIYNDFGFEKEFLITGRTITPQTTNDFTTNIGIIPSYKWLFYIKYSINNVPHFNFEVTDQITRASWHTSGQAKIFVFSWILVGIAILVCLFLYKIIVPRRNKQTKIEV